MDGTILFQSPFEAFAASSNLKPSAPFLIAPASAQLPYAPDGFTISYGEIANAIDRLKAEYAAAGYGRGARVALLLGNRPVFFMHWLALNALGVSIVPINPDLRPDELSFQLTLSRAELLVTTPDRLDATKNAELGRARLVSVDGYIPSCHTDISGQSASPEAECALLFTSGSTGKPKGCMLSNAYFIRVAQWYIAQGGVAEFVGDSTINLTPLPMFHMNALACSAISSMMIGGAVVPLDRFHASRWWASVADSGATVVHCLGVIPAVLLQLPVSEAERRHNARFAFAPGVDVNHRAAFEKRYGIPIVDGWAMTETGSGACTTTAREPAGFGAGCIGRPAATMEYRIVDDEGKDVVGHQPGEFLVRSRGSDPRAGFFSGYLNDPAATDGAWQGGWFHTGDVVYTGADNLLYFFDRKKSIVRRSGENISALEVESIMLRRPSIQAAAVTPVADDLRGEEVFAFVVKSAKATGTDAELAQEIMTACSGDLAYYKLPAYLTFVDSLPLSSTEKLARGTIKALAAQAVANGTALDLRALKAQLRKREPQT